MVDALLGRQFRTSGRDSSPYLSEISAHSNPNVVRSGTDCPAAGRSWVERIRRPLCHFTIGLQSLALRDRQFPFCSAIHACALRLRQLSFPVLTSRRRAASATCPPGSASDAESRTEQDQDWDLVYGSQGTDLALDYPCFAFTCSASGAMCSACRGAATAILALRTRRSDDRLPDLLRLPDQRRSARQRPDFVSAMFSWASSALEPTIARDPVIPRPAALRRSPRDNFLHGETVRHPDMTPTRLLRLHGFAAPEALHAAGLSGHRATYRKAFCQTQ